MPQVSAVLITYNEERDIARALNSVAWCDEIVVVDSGSSDRTVEICLAHGCRVFHRDFKGFGDQKAFAVSQASHDWVLVIDADEEVTPALRDEIRSRLSSAGDCRGFRIPITTLLWDQVLRSASRHTSLKLRLFDRRFGNFGNQLVHESVFLNGRCELLRGRMYNYSYASIADYFEKFNRYTSAAALELFRQGKRSSVLSAILRIPLAFFQLLFIKGYIRDGSVGLMWSLFSSFYPAVKYVKLWELRHVACPQQKPPVSAAPAPPAQDGAPHPSGSGLSAIAPLEVCGDGAIRRQTRRTHLALASAASAAAAVLFFWIPLLRANMPHDYAACLIFVVLVSVCFGPAWAALAITVSILVLDYFAVPPYGQFSAPQSEDAFRLAIFIALSVLALSLVYRARRRSAR